MKPLTIALLALSSATAVTPCRAERVEDDLGRQVSLQQPAKRILTLSPHATELVVAAGAGGHLAAVASGGTPGGVPDALPRIGGPGGVDREAVLALQPDLIVGWHSGNRAGDLEWITANGIALYLSEPRTLPDIAASIRDIGKLSDTRAKAEGAARRFEQAMRTPCADLKPVPVYLTVWERPPMTVGGRHWINAVLDAAGFRNGLAHIDRGVFPIAPEAERAYATLPRISLVRGGDGNDVLADVLSRPGPRLTKAVQMLCEKRLSLTDAGTVPRSPSGASD